MKKLICAILILLPVWGFSQSAFELSGYGRFSSDIRSEYGYDYGAVFEWQPKSGALGLNYSLRFGRNAENDFQFQCPIGAITGLLAVAILADSDCDLSGLGLLFLFVPEGISLNLDFQDDIKIAPYINPLMIEFTKDRVAPIIEVGAKMKVPLGSVLFGSLDFCVQSPYDYSNIKSCVGLSLGCRF